MMNTMEIDGYKAVIQYDPDIELFRGEFIGLNGGADFTPKTLTGYGGKGQHRCASFWRCAGRTALSRARSFRASSTCGCRLTYTPNWPPRPPLPAKA